MKKLFNVFASLVVVIGMLMPIFLYAADTGLNNPSATGNPSEWNNGSSAYTSNNSYANTNNNSADQGYRNFNLSVPAGATINGIEVKAEAQQEGTTCQLQVRLSWNNGSSHTSYKTLTPSGSDSVLTYGGTADTWGRTWTGSEFSNTNFKVEIQFNDPGNGCDTNGFGSDDDIYLDQLQVKVYYTELDTDGDGTPDANETCDTDPGKIAPGQCGCGIADTDTDSDGTADCNDTCDSNPNFDNETNACGGCTDLAIQPGTVCTSTANSCDETAPGVYACVGADSTVCNAVTPTAANSDDDSVVDCNDNCVDVPNNDQTDTDEDGIGDACDEPDCGNGVLESGEACDDGNEDNNDGCTNACEFTCTSDADCTDNNVCNGAESCNTETHTCEAGSAPVVDDGLFCTTDSCDPIDGVSHTAVSVDDDNSCTDDSCNEDTDQIDHIATDADQDGTADCTDNCPNTFNPDQTDTDDDGIGDVCEEPLCGNGEPDEGEGCDDGNITNGDGCSATCQTEETPSLCGNGEPDEGEGCDDGNITNGDGCSATCQIEQSQEPFCGDGVQNQEFEECDDGNENNTDNCSNVCQRRASGGGSVSSIGGGGASSLPETGPETLPEAGPATAETVIQACEEDTYILERLDALAGQPMEMTYIIPSDYAQLLGTRALRLTTQLTAKMISITDPEERNNFIRDLVCRIEMIKEKRGLRHENIGYNSGGDAIDYLLQYLQDLAILQFVK